MSPHLPEIQHAGRPADLEVRDDVAELLGDIADRLEERIEALWRARAQWQTVLS